jgi:hypothetical protein
MTGEPKGLDRHGDRHGRRREGVPVRRLEPFDTLFKIFDQPHRGEEMISMMPVSTLAHRALCRGLGHHPGRGLFRRGEPRKIWELMRVISYDMPGYTRAEVDAEFAKMEQILIAASQPRLDSGPDRGCRQEGPVFAAFGALHLSGEAGVLEPAAKLKASRWKS